MEVRKYTALWKRILLFVSTENKCGFIQSLIREDPLKILAKDINKPRKTPKQVTYILLAQSKIKMSSLTGMYKTHSPCLCK